MEIVKFEFGEEVEALRSALQIVKEQKSKQGQATTKKRAVPRSLQKIDNVNVHKGLGAAEATGSHCHKLN